jgi:hypothetical protein
MTHEEAQDIKRHFDLLVERLRSEIRFVSQRLEVIRAETAADNAALGKARLEDLEAIRF